MRRAVFRLRQLPLTTDRLDIINLLTESIGVRAPAIKVFSLARSVDIHNPSSKIATLMFDPEIDIQLSLKRFATGNSGDEWKIKIDNLPHTLILDTHFRGFTPLYDPEDHQADCIALSGLASHPFGSWQQKDGSKTFMWIRDALPKALPRVRPILYGYDTVLQNSKSFQSILDIACGLLNQLRACGWASPTAKPLLFLAHSLGGLVLKQAFVSLANTLQSDNKLRVSIKGGILFGVPNFGMEQASLLSMVRGQSNEGLVGDLALGSQYLSHLDKQFAGLSFLQDAKIYWAYETKKSPTVMQDSAQNWSRRGPEKILVTPNSATRGLYARRDHSDYVFPINEDHSTMVKFSEDNHVYSILVHKLFCIMEEFGTDIRNGTLRSGSTLDQAGEIEDDSRSIDTVEGTSSDSQAPSKFKVPTLDEVLKSLRVPEQHSRLDEIEERFRTTLDWVFDLPESGFSDWLQHGTGIFWINGKPGSGKSTLMKFIVQDPRTRMLLSDWKTRHSPIYVSFFFHYRGSSLQKSFEGLLRSIIHQILSSQPEFNTILTQFIDGDEFVSADCWTLLRLQTVFHEILEQTAIPLHLTIFLDALDEYDGPKEFICRFLLDIANMTQTPTKDIRICFSSRPWDMFVTSFHKYPNLRPEDFTREDVMRYCLNSLRNEQISFLDYESLITELVDRSRGVFLWVKLVVKDLAVAIQNNQSREELGKYLRSLPIELDDYYAEIITRIPLSHRWKTYAMLEVAVRPDEPLESREFICAVECSNCKTYAAGIATLLKFRNYSDDNFSGFTQNRSKFYCGGLVEVLNANEIGNVQVLHQTVVDFVCDAKFKTLILQERAKITIDNGWTFLAKYRFLESEILESHGWHITQAVRYAIESEMTTGRSLKMFLDTFPPSFFERGGGDYPCSTTAFGFAALTGLRLYMIETLEVDTQVLDNCADPPLALAVTRLPNFPDKDIIATTSLILQRRGEWARRPDITVAAMRTIIKRHTLYQWQTAYDESDLDLVALLIDWGISPDIDLQNGLRPIHVASLDLGQM
ncbi:unnamed protein product [Clonostachys chloroleuca]|uniref:Nephrocystin 3-like N-terminal domain-containing protein n=1 Tax=Clonostachys chloroleuca TaxID=1926264 RepID=A0AA35M0K9_9HYPO|nr:unnamed protein product [Clonostachys chloroleuca]